MQFRTTRRDPDGCLLGEVLPSPPVSSDRLCLRYAQVASRLIAPECTRLRPIVLDPWPFDDAGNHLRRVYDSDQNGEPYLHAAVMAAHGLGRDTDDDIVVALPPALALAAPADAELVMIVIMDAASWEADNTDDPGALSWAGTEIKRAAIAARLLLGAETAGILGARETADGYREICAIAVEGMGSRRYRENGEVLLIREHSGLITALHGVVERARKSERPRLPMSLRDAGAFAAESVRMAVRPRAGLELRAA